MSDPPAYGEIDWQPIENLHVRNTDTKRCQRFSIREEVAESRSQHVAALMTRLLPPIQERAKSGISKTTILLIPSDQVEASSKGQLVGFPQDDQPILIHLEGRYDSVQFWSQQEALDLLKKQALDAVLGDMPDTSVPNVASLQERPVKHSKSWFGGRKSSNAPESKTLVKQTRPPVSVEVQLEQANFRIESEYGLFETLRGRAVLMVVDVR